MILPPMVAPYWLRFSVSAPVVEKKLRASRSPLRMYSNRSPWKNRSPRDLVTTLTVAAGMRLPQARGHGAGLDAELLQGVGERKRHVDVRHGVVGVAAVEQVGRAVPLPAGYGDPDRVPGSLATRIPGVRGHRRAQPVD